MNAANEWIDVNDKLPEIFHEVLTIFLDKECRNKKYFLVAHRDDTGKWNARFTYQTIYINNLTLIPIKWAEINYD